MIPKPVCFGPAKYIAVQHKPSPGLVEEQAGFVCVSMSSIFTRHGRPIVTCPVLLLPHSLRLVSNSL